MRKPDNIQLYERNPREWTDDDRKKLEKNLRELGDLSGIVHDLNSNQICSGNFRSDIFDINKCEIEIVEEYDIPNKVGTVALGFVVWEGIKYNYRAVRWTKEQCQQAVITANALGGDWDYDELANTWDDLPLSDWGVNVWKFDDKSGSGDNPTTGDKAKKNDGDIIVEVKCKTATDAETLSEQLKSLGWDCKIK